VTVPRARRELERLVLHRAVGEEAAWLDRHSRSERGDGGHEDTLAERIRGEVHAAHIDPRSLGLALEEAIRHGGEAARWALSYVPSVLAQRDPDLLGHILSKGLER